MVLVKWGVTDEYSAKPRLPGMAAFDGGKNRSTRATPHLLGGAYHQRGHITNAGRFN
jgi:hypothetical protein